jgi:hypothetical protein
VFPRIEKTTLAALDELAELMRSEAERDTNRESHGPISVERQVSNFTSGL